MIAPGLETGLASFAASIPILVLHGRNDRVVSHKSASQSASVLQAAGFTAIDVRDTYDCAHGVDGPMVVDLLLWVGEALALSEAKHDQRPPPASVGRSMSHDL